MHWTSILPAIITILFAMSTKRILPSIFLGLLTGGYLKTPGILSGIETTIDYILKTLSDKNNLTVILFLYLFSALVNLINRSGGIEAFTASLEKHIKKKKGVFFALWALIPVTFIDCGFRVVATGSILRSVSDKHDISRERMAFMLNNTASPIIELIPFATTFVAYNLGIIDDGLKAAGVKDQSAFEILLHSIPFQFFSLIIIPFTFVTIFMKWRKMDTDKTIKPNKKMSMEKSNPEIQPKLLNLVLPLALVIGSSIGLLLYSGLHGSHKSMSDVIKKMEPGKMMLVALIISLMGSTILYMSQGYSLKKLSSDLISGGNNIISTIAILILAWPLSKVSHDLGMGEFIKQAIGSNLPQYIVPLGCFLLTSLVTYFIGSSWGAEALLMPIAIPLAVSNNVSIALVVAAVISGGSFGDVTSPVSGMTNMAANIAHADHAKYIRKAFRYNSIAAIIAAALFFLVPRLI